MIVDDTKHKAITLRRTGLSYSEILKVIPVAKSTLSYWFKNVHLAVAQKQKLTEKRRLAGLRGAQSRRNTRLMQIQEITLRCKKEVGKISQREALLIGAALYWAEGSKEKENHIGSGVIFSNSDPAMTKFFLHWLQNIMGVKNERITFEIFIHENHVYRLHEVKKRWSVLCGFPIEEFNKVYLKRNKVKTNRKNVGDLYYGQLRVKVRASSNLYKRILGLIQAVVQQ